MVYLSNNILRVAKHSCIVVISKKVFFYFCRIIVESEVDRMQYLLSRYRKPIITLVIGLISLIGWIMVHNSIIIASEGNEIRLWTTAQTVEEAISEAGVSLSSNDLVEPELQTKVSNKLQINIYPAKNFFVQVDKELKEVLSPVETVTDILQHAEVLLGPLDRVEPTLEEKISPGETIIVTRIEVKDIKELRDLAFETEKRPDASLLKGEEKLLIKGRTGKEEQVFKIWLENGVEVAKELITKKIVQQPIAKVVAYGTKQTVSRSGNEINFEKVISMEASAYTHTGNRTRTGIWPKVGVVAVDPAVIPLGTKLFVEGYGYATAADTGGYIKGNRIDLFFDTKEEAMKFGRRKIKVYVLK